MLVSGGSRNSSGGGGRGSGPEFFKGGGGLGSRSAGCSYTDKQRKDSEGGLNPLTPPPPDPPLLVTCADIGWYQSRANYMHPE